MSKKSASFKSIGSNLRALREEAGLTLKEVSIALKLDVSLISKLERDIRLPTVDQCESLAGFYGVSPEMLTKERLLSKVYADLKKHTKTDPQANSRLIKAVLEKCCPRFAPGAEILYVRRDGKKPVLRKIERMKELGCEVAESVKMPDIVMFYPAKKWLILIESAFGNGPIDARRHAEIAELFATVKLARICVTAFPNRTLMAYCLSAISWETEVWIADAPDHLIHFNGERFLGPY